MSNPFFNKFSQPVVPTGMQNFGNLLNQFNQFRQAFNGDPKAQVEQLLASGQMTQEQFNQLSQTAQQFQRFLGKR